MLQYTVRRRRADLEQLEYPDCYDEFDGRVPTGRIVKNISPLEYLDLGSKESEPEVKIIQEKIVDIKKLVQVIHEFGIFETEYPGEFSLTEYKSQIEKKYWIGFVKDIIIK